MNKQSLQHVCVFRGHFKVENGDICCPSWKGYRFGELRFKPKVVENLRCYDQVFRCDCFTSNCQLRIPRFPKLPSMSAQSDTWLYFFFFFFPCVQAHFLSWWICFRKQPSSSRRARCSRGRDWSHVKGDLLAWFVRLFGSLSWKK